LKNTFDEYKTKNHCCYDVIYQRMGTHLVLIVRNSYEGVHSGQIAFPGENGNGDEFF
jgi:hypothetical protein